MIINAPHPLPTLPALPTLFLAGSIEMGTAVNWQQQAVAALEAHYVLSTRADPTGTAAGHRKQVIPDLPNR